MAADTDHNGDDILHAPSTAGAADACSADPACTGFNSWGYVKGAVTPTRPFAGMCLYSKKEVAGPPGGERPTY